MKELYVTYCSARKRPGVNHPERLYISDRITRFINMCNAVGVDWAILSALYGFVFPEEEKKDYNVTFRTDKTYWLEVAVIRDQQKLSRKESEQDVAQLAEALRRAVDTRSIDNIVFYGPSPMMMKCYLESLHFAFDGCSQAHGWFDLIEHVKNESKAIQVIHRLENISKSGSENINRMVENMPKPLFEEIWRRIISCEGEEFRTVTKLPFTYEVIGNYLRPSRTSYKISKSDVAKAYARVPLSGPGEIYKLVRGSSYVYAILHDGRVSNKEW